MWVADSADAHIYAYTLSDGARVVGREFTALDDDNSAPVGIWSDLSPAVPIANATMWVVDRDRRRVFAYNMQSKARVMAKEFPLHAANSTPRGGWSDGRTMWVVNYGDGSEGSKIFAYNLSDGAQVVDQEFNTLNATNNRTPQGIWSNGELMWVSNYIGLLGNRIYTYNVASKEYAPDRE